MSTCGIVLTISLVALAAVGTYVYFEPRLPAWAKRGARHNPAHTRPKRKLLTTTGDVNALEYGGGIVYRDKYGVHWEFWDEPDGDTYTVYRVDVADNVALDKDWVDWESVAGTIGEEEKTIRDLGASSYIGDRVYALEIAVNYYGPHEFDEYPLRLSKSDMKRRWAGKV